MAVAVQQQQRAPPSAFPRPAGELNMIQKANVSKKKQKIYTREVNLAEAAMVLVPEYVDWSEQSITFGREDHPPAVPRPGHAALVLEAQIGGYKMSKVFMDGGAGLNLIFTSTLAKMQIPHGKVQESETQFHGVVPTAAVDPVGRISLNVTFGTEDNFRTEKLEFEVVDWPSQYHAILGRPAFTKFMAVPHYTYLKMKMPGNNGPPITVHGSFL